MVTATWKKYKRESEVVLFFIEGFFCLRLSRHHLLFPVTFFKAILETNDWIPLLVGVGGVNTPVNEWRLQFNNC